MGARWRRSVVQVMIDPSLHMAYKEEMTPHL